MPSPTPSTLSWSQLRHLDHDRAWRVLCRLDREGLLILMARALKVVPIEALESIFSGYAHPHELGHGEPPRATPLLETVQEFTEAALRGEFYEDFSQTTDAEVRELLERAAPDAA